MDELKCLFMVEIMVLLIICVFSFKEVVTVVFTLQMNVVAICLVLTEALMGLSFCLIGREPCNIYSV